MLKRAQRRDEAQQAYARSREASSDHPYPLLNEIKLRANVAGRLRLEAQDRRALARAERMRALQAAQNPPYDKPWCFFDLAEIQLYNGKIGESLKSIRQGLGASDADWQGQTFLNSLQLLEPAMADVPGLDRCLVLMRRWQETGEI